MSQDSMQSSDLDSTLESKSADFSDCTQEELISQSSVQSQEAQENRETMESQSSADSADSSADLSQSDSSGQGDSSDIDTLKSQLSEWKDKYVRAHADFENVKKRLERDKNQALEYAYEKIAKDLLPIIDTLDRAKEAAKEHSAILEGINLTQDNLLKALQKHGIEEISTSGEFDPNLHECIMQVQNEGLKDGDIAQVLQKGYVYKERTLRPAMVAIVKN